jgi:DNA-binding LacI/PurR family transcriptional regulator
MRQQSKLGTVTDQATGVLSRHAGTRAATQAVARAAPLPGGGRLVATIQEVARAAGVAASTVSRYLNDQLRVSPATEARILAAVRELGYVPNARARNLARGRSGVIGFVVPEISNPYFGAIADFVVEAVEQHDRLVLLCSTRSQAVRQTSYIDLLASGAIDGMLYLGSFRSNERLAAAIRDGLPVVVVDEPIAGLPDVHTVVMDDYAGGYQAASYLLALGHRRIAFVSGPAELASVQERRRGYDDALRKAGVDPAAQVSLAGHFTEQFGMSALPRLLAPPDPPTAAFVASDYIALGMLSAAETHGVRVPDDLSVVGFDDIRFSQYVRPRLTTIRSPLERLAQVGVELLFERLADPAAPARTEVLPVELIVRESAAPPA